MGQGQDQDQDQMEGLVTTTAPEAPMHDAPLLSPSPVRHEESHSTFATIPNGTARENGQGSVTAEPRRRSSRSCSTTTAECPAPAAAYAPPINNIFIGTGTTHTVHAGFYPPV
ncbi:hypothetical protein PG987_002739 [Apiospora arundinis]